MLLIVPVMDILPSLTSRLCTDRFAPDIMIAPLSRKADTSDGCADFTFLTPVKQISFRLLSVKLCSINIYMFLNNNCLINRLGDV